MLGSILGNPCFGKLPQDVWLHRCLVAGYVRFTLLGLLQSYYKMLGSQHLGYEYVYTHTYDRICAFLRV